MVERGGTIRLYSGHLETVLGIDSCSNILMRLIKLYTVSSVYFVVNKICRPLPVLRVSTVILYLIT